MLSGISSIQTLFITCFTSVFPRPGAVEFVYNIKVYYGDWE